MRKDHLNHKPSEAGIKSIEEVKKCVIALDEAIDKHVPTSREKSLALTNLEQCRMWAVKGIAISNYDSINEIEGK